MTHAGLGIDSGETRCDVVSGEEILTLFFDIACVGEIVEDTAYYTRESVLLQPFQAVYTNQRAFHHRRSFGLLARHSKGFETPQDDRIS